MTDEQNNIQKYGPIAGGVFGILAVLYFLSTAKWQTVDQPFMGGLFNTAVFGLPLYALGAIFLLLLFGAAYVWWVKFQWGMMTPFHGLWHAQQSQSEVYVAADEKLNYILLSEASASLVFDKERYNSIAFDSSKWFNRMRQKLMPVDQAVHIAKYLQGNWDSRPMTNIGSVPAGLLIDTDGWTKAVSPERTAIAEAVDQWNDIHPDDQIHSLHKAWAKMSSGELVVPGIKLFHRVGWTRIDNAYPKKRYEASWGGFIRQIAENIARGEYKGGISLNTAGIIVFLLLCVVAAMMWVMKLYFHSPVK